MCTIKGINGGWTMPSKRRCDCKKLYSSEGRAMKYAKKRSLVTGEHFVAYKCVDCTGWHMAHAERRA
jgi:hypothetical protein